MKRKPKTEPRSLSQIIYVLVEDQDYEGYSLPRLACTTEELAEELVNRNRSALKGYDIVPIELISRESDWSECSTRIERLKNQAMAKLTAEELRALGLAE